MHTLNMPMQLAHGFIPRLRKRGKGGVVFTSSVEGLIGCPYSGAYSASKAGLNHLTRCLAVAMAPEVAVNCVAPGLVETDMAAENLAGERGVEWAG
mgnify:CR=1 FL=1